MNSALSIAHQLWRGTVIANIAPRTPESTEVSVRARFHFVDTVNADNTCEDCAKLTDQAGTQISSFIIGGTSLTPVVTPWITLPNDGGYASVRFYSNAQDAGRGITMESYDYRRSEVYIGTDGGRQVAAPAWVPLRMPGQYYDEETDLIDNWNRYYDPGGGAYLQIEPRHQAPTYFEITAKSYGLQPPVYTYAFGNPLGFVDRDGRGPSGALFNPATDMPKSYAECVSKAEYNYKEGVKNARKSLDEYVDSVNKDVDLQKCSPELADKLIRDAWNKFNKTVEMWDMQLSLAPAGCAHAFPATAPKKLPKGGGGSPGGPAGGEPMKG